MPDPFAAALDALFNAPGSAAAEFWPGNGEEAYRIRLIRSRGDQTQRFGDGQVIIDGEILDVRISEVPSITPGDRVRIGAIDDDDVFLPVDHLIVTGEPLTDVESMTLTVGAQTIAPFP